MRGPAARRRMIALCALLAGCATDTLGPGASKSVKEHPVTPYATHEECVQLAAGERLDFTFTATEPVDFDIRYREGGATLMPVTREKTQEFGAVFATKFAQRYCLAWEAGRFGALLDYRLQVRPPLPAK